MSTAFTWNGGTPHNGRSLAVKRTLANVGNREERGRETRLVPDFSVRLPPLWLSLTRKKTVFQFA
jgi:hypothetical protein